MEHAPRLVALGRLSNHGKRYGSVDPLIVTAMVALGFAILAFAAVAVT